jgi:bifunctional UDP-N-acetylglucosamine pyrophosphorylase/glucosamine-1-phosphate N-acetyltransferase
MLAGVTLVAPETVFFAYDTELAADVFIEPNVFFGPGVKVSSGAIIHAFSHIEGADIGPDAHVGPFARLRPGAALYAGAKVGNFCEVKNAKVEAGAKVNHLTYIGDARIGANANIGAGTITCNYDGFSKFHTDIGAGAFIGSNSSLVAPVSIGDGGYVASGSVITDNVPADALAFGRSRQKTLPDRGRMLRERLASAKK